MTIKGVSGDLYSQSLYEKKKQTKIVEEKTNGADKLELSQKAKELHKAQIDNRLEEINKRIDGNFYSQKEVTEKVASVILKDLTQK